MAFCMAAALSNEAIEAPKSVIITCFEGMFGRVMATALKLMQTIITALRIVFVYFIKFSFDYFQTKIRMKTKKNRLIIGIIVGFFDYFIH